MKLENTCDVFVICAVVRVNKNRENMRMFNACLLFRCSVNHFIMFRKAGGSSTNDLALNLVANELADIGLPIYSSHFSV
jgi:hypothetical protein